MDSHKNFAYSTVASAPSPADSGTALDVAAGGGLLFPTAPFNATVWPEGEQALASNAEIVRVTNITVDTLTITRAQESTTAVAIAAGYQIAATITAKTLTDVETIQLALGAGADANGDVIATGVKGYVTAINSGVITGWSLICEGASPTITWDVWKVSSGTALPTVANTIMGTKPALTTGNHVRSTTMTGWDVAFSAGDVFGFNVDAVTVATSARISLEYTKT